MSKDAIKRIVNKDLKEIRKMELDKLGIHIEFNEDNMLKARAIIVGPEDTPYENGLLYFIIEFPNNYPFSPPKIGYLSTSRYRIHPNLYVGRSHDNFVGKVCLSSINTWSGPKWTTVMHIGSILLSIQSLLNDNPIQNEPGWEKEVGQRSRDYINIIQYYNIKVAVIDIINFIPDGFEIFKDIMLKYMVKNIEIYRKVISKNEELNNKVLSCFGMQLTYDLRKLEENLTILYSSYSDIYN